MVAIQKLHYTEEQADNVTTVAFCFGRIILKTDKRSLKLDEENPVQ